MGQMPNLARRETSLLPVTGRRRIVRRSRDWIFLPVRWPSLLESGERYHDAMNSGPHTSQPYSRLGRTKESKSQHRSAGLVTSISAALRRIAWKEAVARVARLSPAVAREPLLRLRERTTLLLIPRSSSKTVKNFTIAFITAAPITPQFQHLLLSPRIRNPPNSYKSSNNS